MHDVTHPSGLPTSQEFGLNALGALLSLPSILWGAIVGVLAYGVGTYKDIWWLKSLGIGMLAGSGVQFAWAQGRRVMGPPASSTPATAPPGAIVGGLRNEPVSGTTGARSATPTTSTPTTSTPAPSEQPGTVPEASYLSTIEQAAVAGGADEQEAVTPSGTVWTPGHSLRAARFIRLADGQVVTVAVYRARYPDRVQAALERGRARRTPVAITIIGEPPVIIDAQPQPTSNPLRDAPVLRIPADTGLQPALTFRAQAPVAAQPTVKLTAATTISANASPLKGTENYTVLPTPGVRFTTIGR